MTTPHLKPIRVRVVHEALNNRYRVDYQVKSWFRPHHWRFWSYVNYTHYHNEGASPEVAKKMAIEGAQTLLYGETIWEHCL